MSKMDTVPSFYRLGRPAARSVLVSLVLAVVALAGLAGACGGSDEPEPVESAVPEPVATPLERALELLPADQALARQVLFGDLDRLREAYPLDEEFGFALQGVWLPNALAGANGPLWRKAYGFGLGGVDRFAAGGYHPVELAVIEGTFKPANVESRLLTRGYKRRGDLLRRGKDASIDLKSPVGELAKGSLARVIVTPTRIVAASTTRLAKAALEPAGTLAGDDNIVLAARALGVVTAAVIRPAELARPRSGGSEPLVERAAAQIGVGLDDRGGDGRTVRIALVYQQAADAEADLAAISDGLPGAALAGDPETTFGEALGDLTVRIVGERAILIQGTLAEEASSGLWRLLLERGDLALLVQTS